MEKTGESATPTQDQAPGPSLEFDSLDTVKESIDSDGQDVNLSWAAFHADWDVQARRPKSYSGTVVFVSS